VVSSFITKLLLWLKEQNPRKQNGTMNLSPWSRKEGINIKLLKPKYIILYVIVIFLLSFFFKNMYLDERNGRVTKLKNGEIAPITWNHDVIEEMDNNNIKVYKFKVESKDTILKDKGIKLTDYFYYFPFSKELYYGFWYSNENKYAKVNGDNFIVEVTNDDKKDYGGLAIAEEVGTQGIFEFHSVKPVESIEEVKHLYLSFQPSNLKENGNSELGSPIDVEITLKLIKEGNEEDFPEL
jgi:hypothetical protein